jgi:hypothetical protein
MEFTLEESLVLWKVIESEVHYLDMLTPRELEVFRSIEKELRGLWVAKEQE